MSDWIGKPVKLFGRVIGEVVGQEQAEDGSEVLRIALDEPVPVLTQQNSLLCNSGGESGQRLNPWGDGSSEAILSSLEGH
jgi:hypothetical protein